MKNKNSKKLDLRKGVDHIGVTCVFFCHDGKGNLLMHKRSKNCRDEIGCWDCGSGAMEFGETFERAAKREIMEEYCVTPTSVKFCGFTNVLRKNGKQRTHWIAFIFAAKINPKKVKIGEPKKMEEIGWFRTSKLPQPLHSMLPKHIHKVRRAGVKL